MMNNENRQVMNSVASTTDSYISYKESVKKQIYRIVGSALDEETREATLRLTEERQKAVELLVEENKTAIRDMVEEGKKIIRARAQAAPTSAAFSTEYIDEVITYISKLVEPNGNGTTKEIPTLEIPINNTDSTIWTDLEILPPRDQDEIEAINVYLNSLPQVISVELITMVDKSIFKVGSSEAVDYIEKLCSLPQVLAVEHVHEGERGKIQITLSAKSKLAKTQDEMNAKVKKIFHGKK
ncbi:MAG: hypothetical protein Q7T57_02095 [Dehalococcoidales bacterium]|nr:hypothetical protein [Dehalococcoidales bacterium]